MVFLHVPHSLRRSQGLGSEKKNFQFSLEIRLDTWSEVLKNIPLSDTAYPVFLWNENYSEPFS